MEPSLDFALILTCLLSVTAIAAIINELVLAPRRAKLGKTPSWVIEYAASLFPVILFVWILRSFIVQPYRVPTGSLEPTILPGDFILVSQFNYGIRIPVIDRVVIPISTPKRGQIALFHWPPNPKIFLVKRVIGLPGDHIRYTKNRELYINGTLIKHNHPKVMPAIKGDMTHPLRAIYTEDLLGVKHQIVINRGPSDGIDIDMIVPPHHYFMLGDNRDESNDSRYWGLVPQENLIGKAFMIGMSWDPVHYRIRWSRIGHVLKP